jgi:hypothetical protein
VQELMQGFVAAADEVNRLQRGGDAECKLFRGFCEEGHYGGRRLPTDTRQGVYAVTSSGRFLASINNNRAEVMAGMLAKALERYATMPRQERLLDEAGAAALGKATRRLEAHWPADGLVLRVTSRDLPPPAGDSAPPADGWWRQAWNVDFAWFRAEEARDLLPASPEVGAERELPQAADRLARCCLVDNVRGQTLPYRPAEVKEARLRAEVVAVSEERIELRLTGSTLAEATGEWARGMQTVLRGRAVWDLEKKRFAVFELVARGRRWGRTQYNSRDNDTGARPIGFVFELCEDVPANRVAPAHLWDYGWKLRW